MPTKAEILRLAEAKAMERDILTMGGDPITPTEKELKESGVFREARLELMRGEESEALAQQHQYISEMASELNLKVLEKQSWKAFQRKFAAYRWHKRGLQHLLKAKSQPLPKVSFPSLKTQKPSRIFSLPKTLSKPKAKRRKRHVSRTSKTMRSIRKRVKNGQKSFSFPDHVWKVRK